MPLGSRETADVKITHHYQAYPLPLVLTTTDLIVVWEFSPSGLQIDVFYSIIVFVGVNGQDILIWANIFNSTARRPAFPAHNS